MAFLTVSAVVSSVGGVLSNIASGAIAVIKVVASIAFASVFALAILTLVGGIEHVIFGSIVGEVFGILSVVLPFSPSIVFTSINLVLVSILGFLVAKKTYELTSNLISVSGH